VLKRESFEIARIYVPAKHRGRANPDVVREIAESILEVGQQTPILVRPDGDRFILVEGLHRLEACKALGEQTIVGFLVQARAQSDATPYETEADSVRVKTERLRQLRLAKEAAARATATSGNNNSGHAPINARPTSRRSKSATLVDWLTERDTDGFQN
jgi:ParB/Sulfiredoxin domain